MADIVLALKPNWLELILSGKKTVEARRVLPKNLNPGDKVFLYCHGDIHGVAHVRKVLRTSEDVTNYGIYGMYYIIQDWCGSKEPSNNQMNQLSKYMSGGKESCRGYIVLHNVTRYDDPHPWHGSIPKNFIYYRKEEK